jgi:CheY-like chemotaxis protein
MTGAVAPAPDPLPLRVLYVDDDRINGLLFAAMCRHVASQEGGPRAIVVMLAESGAEALRCVTADNVPDLLVLDLNLPDMPGTDLLPRLRAVAGDESLPAVLCSADLPHDVEPAARAAGFDRCWAKPVDADVLRAELAALAARRSRSHAPDR